MPHKPTNYSFKAILWRYSGKAAWHFVTLPEKLANEIKFFASNKTQAWGSLRVSVTMETTSWKTSLFRDKKQNSYILPIKADIRKKLKLNENDMLAIDIELLD